MATQAVKKGETGTSSTGDSNLSREQIAQYKEAFDLFDKNNDGFITKQELEICVNYFGLKYTDAELEEHITEFDQDGNRKIDFKEYLAVVSDTSREQHVNQDEVMAAFKMFDKNKDGFVNGQELGIAMRSLGNAMTVAEIQEMLQAADFNGDGKIDYKEFTTMMFSC